MSSVAELGACCKELVGLRVMSLHAQFLLCHSDTYVDDLRVIAKTVSSIRLIQYNTCLKDLTNLKKLN